MKFKISLLILAIIGCSPSSEYQPVLDAYFSKGGDYKPLSFELADTTTLQDVRLQKLSMLRVYHPDKTSVIDNLQKEHEEYVKLCSSGLSRVACEIAYARIEHDMKVAFAQLKTIDSLEARIDGFDKDEIADIRARYKFKIGTDTFNYLVVFDGNKNIISADKR
jgi:hypothetical protein